MATIRYNINLAAKVSEFHRLATNKNAIIGDNLEDVSLNIMKYRRSVLKATGADVLRLAGNNGKVAGYLRRIIDGEPLDKILVDVPRTKSGKLDLTEDLQKEIDLQTRVELRESEKETEEGAYENAFRVYEDRHT